MTTIQQLAAIDAAFDKLNGLLDAAGALDSEPTLRAAYDLRLAIVSAIGDNGRIRAAQQSLVELQRSKDWRVHEGQYTIHATLPTRLTESQIAELRDDLQAGYDDGMAGYFNIDSTGPASVVIFYREMSDDIEVIETNLASGKLTATSLEAVVVAQLAFELEDHAQANLHTREILSLLQGKDASRLAVRDIEQFRGVLNFHSSAEAPAAA